jgi:hypothetical protein
MRTPKLAGSGAREITESDKIGARIMAEHRRKNHKENRFRDIDGGHAFLIPVTLLRHPNLIRLSPQACKMLLDLSRQYSGFNNGYQSAAMTIMAPVGWRSEATIREAVAELEHYRIITRTRQGGRNRCNLFAFTFRRIDEKPEKPLDVRATLAPSNEWKTDGIADYQRAPRKRKQNAIPRCGGTLPPQRS